METQQTASNYDQIAHHWAGAEFNLKNGIAQHERALKFLGRAGTAIDVGCGSSGRIIALLLARGFEVEGLDFSGEMLALARQKHPDVRFHHADICTWEFPRRYDFISAWQSIWHVPLAQQPAVSRSSTPPSAFLGCSSSSISSAASAGTWNTISTRRITSISSSRKPEPRRPARAAVAAHHRTCVSFSTGTA